MSRPTDLRTLDPESTFLHAMPSSASAPTHIAATAPARRPWWKFRQRSSPHVQLPATWLPGIDITAAKAEVERIINEAIQAGAVDEAHGDFGDRVAADLADGWRNALEIAYRQRLDTLDGTHRDLQDARVRHTRALAFQRDLQSRHAAVQHATWNDVTAGDFDPAPAPPPTTALSDELGSDLDQCPTLDQVLSRPATSREVPGNTRTNAADRPQR